MRGLSVVHKIYNTKFTDSLIRSRACDVKVKPSVSLHSDWASIWIEGHQRYCRSGSRQRYEAAGAHPEQVVQYLGLSEAHGAKGYSTYRG
eukprot:16452343-Heterocapsa_arctica.AAC.2